MSLMKTLAKVAIGVAVAKGAKSMMKGGGQHASRGGGSLQDMLGGLMGGSTGAASAGGGMSGGLGGLLEGLTGRKGGGLQDMLSGLAGSAGAGGLMGALATRHPQTQNAGFGEVLNSAFDETPQPEIEPSADQEAAAALMLRAMIQAAKSDGRFDETERKKLLDHLGDDIDADEATFVQNAMAAPVDVEGLIAQTPSGMEKQVYAVSILGINLDEQSEAQYLHKLAKGYGMDAQAVNAIHEQLGVPSLYT